MYLWMYLYDIANNNNNNSETLVYMHQQLVSTAHKQILFSMFSFWPIARKGSKAITLSSATNWNNQRDKIHI